MFSKDDAKFEGLLQTVKKFSNDVGIKFGLKKCAKAIFERRRLIKWTSKKLENNTTITELEHEEVYKYFGVIESSGIHHVTMRVKISKKCYWRVRAIFNTECNTANQTEAFNMLAIPVVIYSFDIINWTIPDIKKIDIKTQNFLTSNRMHHLKAGVEQLYLPRCDGGKEMIQMKMNFKITTTGLCKYLSTINDWMLQLVLQHDARTKAHSISQQSNKFR